MSNSFFDWPAKTTPERFVAFDTVRSADVNDALDLVSAGFEKLPTPYKVNAGSANYAADTGADNAYAVALSAQIDAYTAGLKVKFKPVNANTGACTLNVNSLGVKSIKLPTGANPAAGDIAADVIVEASYDGTNFQLLNPVSSVISAAASATAAASSASSAAASASTATTQADLAVAAYDSFDDRYLGAKAADPALDNDGNALIAGALYWNTTSSAMLTYTGSVWTNFAGGAFARAAYTIPVAVAYGTTVTINAALSNVFHVGSLTGNVTTLTLSNPSDGQTINIRFVQDATGGRSVTLPASVKAAGAIQTSANLVTWLNLSYVSSASLWEGSWSQVPA